jgi:glycine cleavage system H protein
MEFPENFYYSKDHEWISALSGEALVGVSQYAIDQLGDVVHIDLPPVGKEFKEGEVFGTIESTKTVSDLYLPGSGKIVAVNKEAVKNPESLQQDPYQAGWLVKVALAKKPEAVLSREAYENYIRENG